VREIHMVYKKILGFRPVSRCITGDLYSHIGR